jgi:hypothetical protein
MRLTRREEPDSYPQQRPFYHNAMLNFRVSRQPYTLYRDADKSLARPTSPCILSDGENISFDASLVIYIGRFHPFIGHEGP